MFIMSSTLNCQLSPNNLINEYKNTISHSQSPGINLLYSTSILHNSGMNNPIRKRKVKFTIQLTIQELQSVPYLNGVLFCKVRLCDGGHYVSYSSKQEVSNSSVLWTNDSSIQFDVKTTQFYQYTSVASSPVHCSDSGIITNNSNNQQNNYVITGYEPCLCRISVRKELRGGKSYQKLGYVDCNLTDFIYKYQLEQNQLIQNKNNGQFKSNSNIVNSDEFSVNRILKEYETGSQKKNQQRLDNSYLKIKIKIIDNNQMSNQNSNKNLTFNTLISPTESEKSFPASPKQPKSLSPSITYSSEENNNQVKLSNESSALIKETEFKKNSLQSQQVQSLANNIQNQSPELLNKPVMNNNLTNFTPSHSRNSSSSTTNSTVNTNTCHTLNPNSFVNGHYSDLTTLSCSNGSIKSNVSFDFLIKNRNKKLLEDVQSTSSSSSHANFQLNNPILNSHPLFNGSSNSNQTLDQNILYSKLSNHSLTSTMTKIEPSSSNLHIIETRVDANEIINQIENELTNRLSGIKSNE